MVHAESFHISTRGRGTVEITGEVRKIARALGIAVGLCNVFVHHTSASLIITENADPDVRRDLDRYLARLVPDGDRLYAHTAEGPDDMAAHLRSVLTATSVAIPIADGDLNLGTWQGIFLYEHRAAPHRRRLTVTVVS